jgi:hypothetical protein
LDLTSNVGVPHPTIGLGTAYTWQRWLTLAGDLRYRKGLAEFYPGLEASYLQGLLKVRLGRGFQLDGVSQVAVGMGVNFSPVTIDVAMTCPTASIHREAGGYQASVNYRFGAPSFSGNFVGQAAAQADSLSAAINQLDERKKTLESETQSAETNRGIVSDQMAVLQKRFSDTEDELRLLEKKKDELEYDISTLELKKRGFFPPPPPPPKPKPKPVKHPPTWPRQHQVKPGDTLRSIAQYYYNDAGLWDQIYDANRDKIDRGLPQEGAVLIIPEPKR